MSQGLPGHRQQLGDEVLLAGRAVGGVQLQPGELVAAVDLLDLLAERGLTTALVTNNSQRNTELLLARFGLHFDVVVTRDSGLWKPSGEPIAEAARREVSEQSIGRWKAEFLEAGKTALAAGKTGPSSREAQLEAEVAELTQALGEAAVEIRVWKKSAEGRLGPSPTSR